MAFRYVGLELAFEGKDENEVGRCVKTGKVLVKIDPRYYRPAEVDLLIGDATKAKHQLGWEARTSVEDLCREMVAADLYQARQDLSRHEHAVPTMEELAHNPTQLLQMLPK